MLLRAEPWLVVRGALRRWTPAGYAETARPRGALEVITPPEPDRQRIHAIIYQELCIGRIL